MDLPDFLTESEGEIRIAGHRLELEHLVDAYNNGDSAEMLASRFPTLSLSLVHRVIAFYLDHQDEVDAYVARCAGERAGQRAKGQIVDLTALRQRLAEGLSPASSQSP